jgi:GTP-binding protein
VGKSSLFNAILQEERVVVSPIPHTTRDPNITEIEYNGYYFHLVDTAGLAKKARVYDHGEIEIFSVKKTLETIKKADIGILMINANEGASLQDKKIRALLEENRCGIIILANKWDMVSAKNTATLGLTRKKLYDDFKSINWAPIIFSSVANHRRGQIFGIEDRFVAAGQKSRERENPIYELLDVVISVFKNRHTTVSDEELKKLLARVVARKAPPRAPGFPYPKISRVTQVGVNPPRFSIHIPKNSRLADHYFGYLTNQLRESFQLWGTVVSVGVG